MLLLIRKSIVLFQQQSKGKHVPVLAMKLFGVEVSGQLHASST
jgi:hypothetical protein